MKRDIRTKSGPALLDFILADIQELKRILFDPQSHQVFMAAMEATWWLNEQLEAWLGEKNAADTLTQSVPHNVTSEMGLALLDVADVIRPHPEVVAFLQHVEDEGFLDELPKLAGGREARDAIRAWLDKYGMRCVGEIDITRPRWSERPTTLVPMILGNIKNFEPGAGKRRFEQGRQEAWKKEQELLERLRALPDGERKAEEAKRMIDRVRTFIGYREYPKYGMVSRYFVYKQALLEEAERLVQAHVLREKEDIFYLRFQELQDVVRTNQVDDQLIRAAQGRVQVVSSAHAAPGAHVGWRGRRRGVPTRRRAGRRAGRPAGFRRDHRGAGPRHPGHGGGRSRSGRHPGHRLHGPQLDAPVRRDQGPGDGGGGPDDPWRGDRTGVRLAGRRGRGACHPADPGWAADPRAWNGRVRRDPALVRPANLPFYGLDHYMGGLHGRPARRRPHGVRITHRRCSRCRYGLCGVCPHSMDTTASQTTRWTPRPMQARLIRAVALVAPFAASIVFVALVSAVFPAPLGSFWLYLAWWVVLTALATLVLVAVDRVARRLLPLAVLFKLSLVFPDRAPSRFRTALNSRSVDTLEERVAAMKAGQADATPVEAAQELLELVAALDTHDPLTRGHSDRVRAYSQMIAEEMKLSEEEIDLLNWAALLHDIGKLEVPTEILEKEGRPNDEEWAILRRHPEFGGEIVAPLRGWLGAWANAVSQHHERWDGGGYPAGATGEQIGLAARIVAVADVFDVITSARSYKSASDAQAAREEIAHCAGAQFDPRVVRAFLAISLGKLRFAMGPLSWLSHAPLLGRLPLTPAIGTVSGALAVAAAAVTTGIVGPPPPERAPAANLPNRAETRWSQPTRTRRSSSALPAQERRGRLFGSSAAHPQDRRWC